MKSLVMAFVLGLPAVSFASGNVNSAIKFPDKGMTEMESSDKFKCQNDESLKDCMNRFKMQKKDKMDKGGGK